MSAKMDILMKRSPARDDAVDGESSGGDDDDDAAEKAPRRKRASKRARKQGK